MQYRYIPGSGVLVLSSPCCWAVPPVRTKIRGFSSSSQANLRKHLDRIDSKHVPLFIDLTFAREADYQGDPEQAKLKLRSLGNLIRRAYPCCHTVWKREWQTREKFDHVPVLHFHLAAYGIPYQVMKVTRKRVIVNAEIESWFKVAWQKRGGGFVDCQGARDANAIKRYIGRWKGELSKKTQTRADRDDGRWWGHWGKVDPYLAEVYQAPMEHARGERLMRAVDAGNQRLEPRDHYYCGRLQSRSAFEPVAAARVMSFLAGNDDIPIEEVAGHFIWKRWRNGAAPASSAGAAHPADDSDGQL